MSRRLPPLYHILMVCACHIVGDLQRAETASCGHGQNTLLRGTNGFF